MALTGSTKFVAKSVRTGLFRKSEVVLVLQVQEALEVDGQISFRWKNAAVEDLLGADDGSPAEPVEDGLPDDFVHISGFTGSEK